MVCCGVACYRGAKRGVHEMFNQARKSFFTALWAELNQRCNEGVLIKESILVYM